MEEGYGETELKRVSKFHSGFQDIDRLDELWRITHRLAIGGALSKWNWVLDRIWCELGGDIDETDERVAQLNNINTEISMLTNKVMQKEMKPDIYNAELYTILMKKELFLRRLQNSIGKGTAYDNDDYDID